MGLLWQRGRLAILAMTCAAALGLPVAAGAAAPAGAETRTSGPALTVPAAALQASLTCGSGVRDATQAPILLVPGTTLDPSTNFSWNYELAFTERGMPWCAVTLPGEAMANIATAAQYVTYAIRTMHTEAGRRIDIMGYSQGGMVPRWSLKYWPDTRADVADFAAIDPSNHGTLDAYPACAVGGCAPAFWQQQTGSQFITALDAGPETWAGIDYSVIYSRTDEVVVPNLNAQGSSSLHTGAGSIADIAVQSICPTDISDHLAMGTYDPVAYALVIDAFTHPGVASASRIPRSVCAQGLMPAINKATFAPTYAAFLGHVATVAATYPHVPAEPPLPGYAR